MKRNAFQHCHQLNMMDCGPACLQMVAKHYGRYFRLESLREKCFITREGVSMIAGGLPICDNGRESPFSIIKEGNQPFGKSLLFHNQIRYINDDGRQPIPFVITFIWQSERRFNLVKPLIPNMVSI
ncbi:MAG: cysteine peptidase family C39 domain-containing protein [Bacteroidaceae bacterium]|nr:cysteine peptidase family C39 domain-containing protein [Bacteroidaceae bacterium]